MQEKLFEFISGYVSLTDEEKQAIESLDIFRSEKKGSVLLAEGQRSRQGFFVLQGCLRTYYMVDGEERTTAFYTEMEGLTPNCVLSGNPSEYYISCVEDSIITVSTPEMETEIFKKFPKFETLCRILSEQLLVKSQVSFDQFKNSSPEERYLHLLLVRPDLPERVPQHQLAGFLGITPQSLSRIRARLVREKK